MGNLISMHAEGTGDGFSSPSARASTSVKNRFTRVDGHERGKIIPFDSVNRDLRLLQAKGRKLEERKFVLYKGLLTATLSDNTKDSEVTIRVLVKKRQVEYYFYCPLSGERLHGNVDCRTHCGMDCDCPSWPEIQEMVRRHVQKAKCDSGQRTGQRMAESVAASNAGHSDKQLAFVQMAKGVSDNDPQEDSVLHRLLRKFSPRGPACR